jgi:hypothetical protein
MDSLSEFLYPQSRCRGEQTPKNLIFNAKLQQYAQRIGLIANLQTGGKLTLEEALSQVETLWEAFEADVKTLALR